jgi:SAM-dependent methyltransferase
MKAAIPYDGEFYKRHPLSCAADDYWGQVRRTVAGKPVDEAQIQLIVDAVSSGLELKAEDWLLDLCCGNGALSDRFFKQCQGGVGVDFSPPLVEVAQRVFQTHQRSYHLADVEAWVLQEASPLPYTIALCYGSFSYLEEQAARKILSRLHRDFINIRRIYLGNLPDAAQADALFAGRERPSGIERRHDSQFGILRTQEEVRALARETGWALKIHQMPPEFYAARFRFDAILVRDPSLV